VGLGDLFEDWLEGSTWVPDDWSQGSISFCNDPVLGVNVEDGLQVRKEVWVELEFW